MDDMRTLVKELHRIADSSERIAKALEKQNKVTAVSPQVNLNVENDAEKVKEWKEWVLGAMENALNKAVERT